MGKFYSDELERGIQLLYHQGDKAKYPEAVSLIERAAANNEPDAFYVLARCYAWGDSGFPDSEENDKKALELSQRGAELGSNLAILGADRFFALEELRPYMKVSHEQAFEGAVKQAEEGNPLAMYAVGLVYFWGDVLELPKYALASARENAVEGVKWFDRATALGFMPAFRNAYISRTQGTNDVPVDVQGAIALVERVQDSGVISSSFFSNIGNDYEKIGRLDKMLEWYNRGVAAGDDFCMFNLAVSYEKGIGVEKSEEMAIKYYQMAKDAGYGPEADAALKKFNKSFFGSLFGKLFK